ncbi:MAG: bifunctional glutamate N-acetyltransferase/amino-acid acetyltransferase ArgJ [Polyangiales bacterium]
MSLSSIRFAGVHAGIKAAGALDLALIAADRPCAVAALYTQNRVQAAPVRLSQRRSARGLAQAIVVNSGNANACTGAAGMQAATRSCAQVAAALGIDPELVLVASTGVIGTPLPVARLEAAVPALVADLCADGWPRFAQAIMTTDRGPKTSQRTAHLDQQPLHVLGVGKGAGMYHPDMATTLAFLCIDAVVPASLLQAMLRRGADATFHRASVDGDTSTNDSLFLLATGDGVRIDPDDAAAVAVAEAAVTEVLEDLTKQMVADGEGAAHLVRLEIRGAPNDDEALQAARAVATSPLVKTALAGVDPNWGRIAMALGRSGAHFDPEQLAIRVEDIWLVRQGTGVGQAAEEAARVHMQRPEYTLHIDLGAGQGKTHYWMCDMGHEYIRINADYRS